MEQRAFEILEGLIFSDIHVTKMPSPQVRFATTHKQYFEEVREFFTDLGWKTYACIAPQKDGFSVGKTVYQLEAYNKSVLAEFRKRWYDENSHKCLPKDFNLTPLVANVAYCGDGWISKNACAICTHGFSEDDVDRIVLQLKNHGIQARKQLWKGSMFQTDIANEYIRDFLEWMGQPVFKCFAYKWKYDFHLDANAQEESKIVSSITKIDPQALYEVVRNGKLSIWRLTNGAGNPHITPVLRLESASDVFGILDQPARYVKGRKVKRILEAVYDHLEGQQRSQADLILALPLGRRRQDIKGKIFSRFRETFGSLAETECGNAL